jgi:hypothetical protein
MLKVPTCQYSDIISAENHHRRQIPIPHKRAAVVVVLVVAAAAATSALEGLLLSHCVLPTFSSVPLKDSLPDEVPQHFDLGLLDARHLSVSSKNLSLV